MDLLTAFNIILRAVNEEAIGDLETESYIVSQVEPVLESTRLEILEHGYQFNTDKQTLTADNDGVISVPSGTLRVLVPDSLRGRVIERGGKLWDRENSEHYAEDIEVWLVKDVQFEDLPELFARWIAYEAAVQFDLQVHQGALFAALRQQADKAKIAAANSEYVTFDFDNWSSMRRYFA